MQRVAVKAEALRSQALRRANSSGAGAVTLRAFAARCGSTRPGSSCVGNTSTRGHEGRCCGTCPTHPSGIAWRRWIGDMVRGEGGAPDAAGGGRGSFNGTNLRQALAE